MTAAELLNILVGVPYEALPKHYKSMIEEGAAVDDVRYDIDAAVGAMVAWLGERGHSLNKTLTGWAVRVLKSSPPQHDEARRYTWTTTFATPIEALASACRAVATPKGAPHG